VLVVAPIPNARSKGKTVRVRERLKALPLILAIICPIVSVVAIVVTMSKERSLCEVSNASSDDEDTQQPVVLQRALLILQGKKATAVR
jgi:hypothetical protein